MPTTVKATFVVDTDCPKAANVWFAHLTEMLAADPSMRDKLIAAEGTVRSTVSMPLVTENDVDRRWDDLIGMAKSLSRHATDMEQEVVEQRLRLTHTLHRDLNRLVDQLEDHAA